MRISGGPGMEPFVLHGTVVVVPPAAGGAPVTAIRENATGNHYATPHQFMCEAKRQARERGGGQANYASGLYVLFGMPNGTFVPWRNLRDGIPFHG